MHNECDRQTERRKDGMLLATEQSNICVKNSTQKKTTYGQRTRAAPCPTSTAVDFQRTLVGCLETPAEGLTDDGLPRHRDRRPHGPTAPEWPPQS